MSVRIMTMPWDPPADEGKPLTFDLPSEGDDTPSPRSLEDTVKALQADMLFAVRHTGVLVRSNNEELRMVINTERGQLLPPGTCTFTDGGPHPVTVEFQDIGMPQPGMPLMTMQELARHVFHKANEMGLEIA